MASWTEVALAQNTAAFQFVEHPEGRLQLLEGNQPVLTYNWGDQLKPGVPEHRTRSCYVHPIWGLNGEMLTDDFPKDHYHHRGLSWMWPHVTVNEREVSLWDIRGIRQHFHRWLQRKTGPDGAVLGVENDWRLDNGEIVAKERVRLKVHPAGETGRAIDVRLEFESLEQPVTLQGQRNADKGYGGLCFRFPHRDEVQITTDEGPQETDSVGKPFRWADMTGRFGEGERLSGAAIFVHPDHPDYPTDWILRHYGFLGADWPGLDRVTLEPNQPVTLRYRLWLHQGDAETGNVAEAYRVYRESLEK